MSEAMKGKYEVLRMIRANVLKGLNHFGLPVPTGDAATDATAWNCLEYDQASFKNYDRVVLLRYAKGGRVGWQFSSFSKKSAPSTNFDQKDTWIEQQEWEIQAVLKRKTTAVNANTVTTEDVANYLIAWFNGNGIAEFRKSKCGNLLINQSSVRTYKGGSDVPQFRSIFTLKLQVPKTFVHEIPSATVRYEGQIGV